MIYLLQKTPHSCFQNAGISVFLKMGEPEKSYKSIILFQHTSRIFVIFRNAFKYYR